MANPTLTPVQALAQLRQSDPIIVDGFQYMLDGPMGTPTEFLAPTVTWLENTDHEWYCTGEPGDKITDQTQWLHIIDGEIQ